MGLDRKGSKELRENWAGREKGEFIPLPNFQMMLNSFFFPFNQIQSMPHLFSNKAAISSLVVVHVLIMLAKDHKILFA